jgi:uncharacterized membrane protein
MAMGAAMITFTQPLLLLLLVPIAVLIYFTWKRMSLPFPRTQRRLILLCRLALFTLLIAALAGATWLQPATRQTTIFVGDISASTQPQRAFIEHWISSAISDKGPNDQVGIVAVGRNALVEQAVSSQVDFSHFESTPDTNYTDLAAGLRLAAAILPSDTTRHIVLLTDGQQNLGDALQEAQLLQQQGIRLDIVPLPEASGPDARIDGVDAPTQVRTNERFLLHVQLYSNVEQNAIVRLYLDQDLLTQLPVHLPVGNQAVSFQLPAPPPGFHTFRVTLDAPQDSIPQNDEASAFVDVQGPPQVLLIEGTPGSGANIRAALKATNINVVVGTPNDVPTSLDGLAPYSAVVLADVPAVALGTARMQILQSFVRDLGRGLVVSGGQNSYGIGGYANTPLEQTLPLSMDIPQHKDTPSIAVVLIVESLESDAAVNISKEAAKGVVNLLTPQDQVGISDAYGSLIVPMQHVTNKSAIDHTIDTMNPNDPASYLPDLINAEHVLLHTDAKIKHVILLGDGDAYDNYAPQVLQMAKENITVSTVATNADSYADLAIMQEIASWGKGRFYRADNPAAVPQVLLKETQQAARRAIINEPFTPAIVGANPILTGLGALPGLDGYVATTPKPTAQVVLISHIDDPVLAVWQYGLGRVAAWTSDALGLWTAHWLSWNEAARWWANLVTWTLPTPDSSLSITGKVIGGTGQLTVDVPPGTATSTSGQQVQARIIAPDLSQATVTLQPTAPEQWQGSFPALQVGSYLLQVTWRGTTSSGQSSQLVSTTGMVVPYSPEFRTQGTDIRFLKLLAQAGGGILLNPNDPTTTFMQALTPVSAAIPIAFWLLTLAALLLPIDVGLRRLSSLEFLSASYQWLVAHFPLRQTKVATVAPTPQSSESPLGTQLNAVRAKREARRQAAPAKPMLPKETPHTATPKLHPPTTITQATPAADAPEVSTTEQLLAAKRKRAQQRTSNNS